jgi:hypothetical protein
MSTIEVDKSQWPPIMIYTFNGDQTPEDMEGLMTSWKELVELGKPFGMITKLNKFDADISHVKPVATWAKAHMDLLNKYGCASAIVSKHSRAVQILLNAFLILAPMPFPSKIVSSEEEALVWVKERVAYGPLR